MMEEMRKKTPAVKSCNWRLLMPVLPTTGSFYDGETKQLQKQHIYEKKQHEEALFQQWAKGKPEFEHIFSNWEKAYEDWRPYAKNRQYINEGIMGSPPGSFFSIPAVAGKGLLPWQAWVPQIRKKAIDESEYPSQSIYRVREQTFRSAYTGSYRYAILYGHW